MRVQGSLASTDEASNELSTSNTAQLKLMDGFARWPEASFEPDESIQMLVPPISWTPYPSSSDFSSIDCEELYLFDDNVDDSVDRKFAIIACKSIKVSFFRYYLTDHTESDV